MRYTLVALVRLLDTLHGWSEPCEPGLALKKKTNTDDTDFVRGSTGSEEKQR